jgi:YfiH family protein
MTQENPTHGLDIVRIPQWQKYEWLRHGFSTRAHGTSRVYGGVSLNLGWTKEDDPTAVAENRNRFQQAIEGGSRSFALVTLRQVHSRTVRSVKEEDQAAAGKLQTAEGKAVLEGDGLVTSLPGVLLAVGTADCVPVLVVDLAKRVVAAFHAGWRGTKAQIVEHGIAAMQSEYGSRVEDLVAATGPSIGACCYAVGDEVKDEFGKAFDYAEDLFSVRAGKTFLNLWQANRRQLRDAGVSDSQITIVGECTACTRDKEGRPRYFSHRGEHGVAGRMLNVVGIAP